MDGVHDTGPAAPSMWRAAGSLLRRNRDFRLFFAGQLISLGGDWFLIVALSNLILSLTGSATLVAALFVAYNLPYGFVSFLGGPLADRIDRRRLMIVTNALMGLLALGFFLVHGRADLWLVFVLAAGISAVSALFEPAASAAVPNLVDADDLPAANVLAGSSWGTMMAVGAGIGGLVVGAFGNDIGYLVDAVSFFAAGLLLVWVRRRTSEEREPREDRPGIARATREAVAYSRRDHRVLALFAVRGGVGVAIGVVALLPVLAVDTFHAGSAGTGWLFAFRGLGSLIGPFLIRPFVRRGDSRRLFDAILWTPVVFAALYAASPWAPDVYLAGVAAMGAHLAGGANWTLSTYTYQRLVPDRVRGRVFGFDGALLTFTLSASNAVCGWLAGAVGVRVAMSTVGGAVVLYTLLTWTATRRLRRSLGPVPGPAAAAPRLAR